jgi:hypothetical protein
MQIMNSWYYYPSAIFASMTSMNDSNTVAALPEDRGSPLVLPI